MNSSMEHNLFQLSSKIAKKEKYSIQDIEYLNSISADDSLLNKSVDIVKTLEHNPFSPIIEKDLACMITNIGIDDEYSGLFFSLPRYTTHLKSYNNNPETYQYNSIKFFEDLTKYVSKYRNLDGNFYSMIKNDSSFFDLVSECLFTTGHSEFLNKIEHYPINSLPVFLFFILYRNNAIQNVAILSQQDYNQDYDKLFCSIKTILNNMLGYYFNDNIDLSFGTLFNDNTFIPDGVSELVTTEIIMDTYEKLKNTDQIIYDDSHCEIDRNTFDIIIIYFIAIIYRYYIDLELYYDSFITSNSYLIPIRNRSNLYNIFIEDKYVKNLVRILKNSTTFQEQFKSNLFLKVFKEYCIESNDNKSINILKLI